MLGEKVTQWHHHDSYTFNICISQTELLNLQEKFHHISSAGKKIKNHLYNAMLKMAG